MQTQTRPSDLWPEDFGVPDFVPPISILREQATALGAKTRNIVGAEVITTAESGKFHHHFYVKSVAAGDYRYLLFSVEQEATPYPLRINWAGGKSEQCDSEQDFLQMLKAIFSEEHTKQVIQSLIAYSTT